MSFVLSATASCDRGDVPVINKNDEAVLRQQYDGLLKWASWICVSVYNCVDIKRKLLYLLLT